MPDEAEEELRGFLEETEDSEDMAAEQGDAARSTRSPLADTQPNGQPRWAVKPSEADAERPRHPPLSIPEHPWCSAPQPADTNVRIPAGIRAMLVMQASAVAAALPAWDIRPRPPSYIPVAHRPVLLSEEAAERGRRRLANDRLRREAEDEENQRPGT